MAYTDKIYSFEENKKANRSDKAVKVLTFIIVFAVLIIGIVLGIIIGSRNGIKQGNKIVSEMNTTEPVTYEPETLISEKYRTGDYVITGADELRLRDDHTTNGNMLIAVPRGTRITVSDVYYDPSSSLELQYWGLTSYMGHSGWIALYYTENAYSSSVIESLTEPPTALPAEGTTVGTQLTVTRFVPGEYIVNSDSTLRIRQTPSVDSDMIEAIPKGVKITVTEVFDDPTAQDSLKHWGKVTYNDCTGWIAMFYLLNVPEETSAPETTLPENTETTLPAVETVTVQ